MLSLVTVRLLDVPYSADRDYDYLLPSGAPVPAVGQLLLVPFGVSNRPSYAVAVSRREEETSARPLKEIYAVLPPDYRVTEEILRLCFFLRDHTLCSVGEALRAAFPGAALGELREVYRAKETPTAVKTKADRLLSYLWEHEGITKRALETALGTDAVKGTLSRLCREGRAERIFLRAKPAAPPRIRFYTLVPTGEQRRALLRGDGPLSEKQRTVCLFLDKEGVCAEGELLNRLNISDSPLKTLVKRGVLAVEEREAERNPYAALSKKRDTAPVALSRAQSASYEEIEAVYEKHRAACVLLHGVTGSGKTKLMIRLLDRVLAEGGQAILLVPEIALTPQTVGIFCARYGERVSVLHSSLSTGERFDAYRRILRGDADLVIGTRSAVFAPLSRLSLILIDEEHEHTYKSDAAPRYHTKDVAAFRSGEHAALTLLASATPSIESYYKAKTGKYTLVSLAERYGGTLLPVTEIVDMREELRSGNTSPISRRLSEALLETVEEGKQAVLFLNRRGYHHTVSCRGCGEALLCPHCSVSFTYHSSYSGSYLLCHACGTKRDMPRTCPSCGGEHLSFLGAGTQKAEAELSAQGEGVRVLRMDADTTAEKSAYDRILSRFRKKEADVLLGTQMVTKGHDFPAVGLSGVLLADASLYTHDYRASERTFALLTQVIGRAGRAGEVGRAVVQTYSPEHKVLRLAAEQNYPAFYEEEIEFRRAMCYPPFCDIAMIGLSCADEKALLSCAAFAKEHLLSLLSTAENSPAYALYGPLEAGAYKVAERYRLRLLVKCRLSPALRRLYGTFLTEFTRKYPSVSLTVDFNPTDI
ncbi:MAG: primosomal protein N' [Ruminococcaceae bacterium]|nr:primosomal protein N' [Oscillospiraceae bacterium]